MDHYIFIYQQLYRENDILFALGFNGCRYQKSNDGNFPSLNLTHKEVGGSFYKVRELVREIIQENRVLGPAKLSPEEKNNIMFAEQYPLGSISTEPQSLSLSGETHVMSNFAPNHYMG